ncbi:hypothetical protein [Erwinia mallotivora]|uniref:hypothetical protein n=1 Tax=Erwinia mallotivora TaxID=69222 RepID=UPI0021C03D08|nr:hypothetical protein [Erwinia mallotivora]
MTRKKCCYAGRPVGCHASHRAGEPSLPGPVPGQRVSILTQHLSLAAAVPAAPLSRAVSGAQCIPPQHTAGRKGQRRFATALNAIAAGSCFPQGLCSPV